MELAASAIKMVGKPVVAMLRPPHIRPPISRSAFRSRIPLPALEIGPFDVPFLVGGDVEYFDILDQAQLRQRAIEHFRNPQDCPFIHYTGTLSTIQKQFAAVFSSHTIEHTPDLVGHLTDVCNLLRPGGSYFVIVPDKRYCFDHFLPESSFGDVEDGRGRQRPTLGAVTDHLTRKTHNRPMLHWLGVHGRSAPDAGAAEQCARATAGEYVDVHQWQFTPKSFRDIALALGIFASIEVHDTPFGDLEFCAILRK